MSSIRSCRTLIRGYFALALLVGLAAPITSTVVRAGSDVPVSTPGAAGICESGRLHVGQIPELAGPWAITIEADRSLAVEWRPDAVLVTTDLGCGFRADQPRIRTTFFSADARGLWDPETAQLRPLDPGDPAPKELPAANVDWDVVHDTIVGLGFTDDDQIGASGITVRLRTDQARFGPDSIPSETVVVHLTIGDGAATRDVYLDGVTGETYSFNADEEAEPEPAG